MSTWASYLAGRLHYRLQHFAEANHRGWVFPSGATYRCLPEDPNRVVRSAVSFIRYERLPFQRARADEHLLIAPDLVAEVACPADLEYEIGKKAQDWLRAGVPRVWILRPEMRGVAVHRLHRSGTIL